MLRYKRTLMSLMNARSCDAPRVLLAKHPHCTHQPEIGEIAHKQHLKAMVWSAGLTQLGNFTGVE